MQLRARSMKAGMATLAIGLATMATPGVAWAQKKAPPPPSGAQPPPAQPPPQDTLQPPPQPPAGAQPPPGYAPYPPPQYGPPGYPPPYGQPGYPPPYGYPGYPLPPETLPYKSDQPIPPGYKVQEKARTGLIVAGSIILGLFYIGSVAVAVDEFDSSRAPYPALFVPVLGPFIVAAGGNWSSNFFNGGSNTVGYIFNGVIQSGSAAMLLAGIFAKKKSLIREDLLKKEAYQPELLVGPGSVGMKMAF